MEGNCLRIVKQVCWRYDVCCQSHLSSPFMSFSLVSLRASSSESFYLFKINIMLLLVDLVVLFFFDQIVAR